MSVELLKRVVPDARLMAAALLMAVTAMAADETVTGNLTVTGATDVGGAVKFGTQGGAAGVSLTYANADADTLTFFANRNPASFLWAHTTAVAAMRLTAAHELILYRADSATEGIRLTPTTNTISLGSTLLYRDAATGTLRTNGALTVDSSATIGGVFTAASIVASNGVLAGGPLGLSLAAGGANQNISLTPSGAGHTLLGGKVGIGTTAPWNKLTVQGPSGGAGASGTDGTGGVRVSWSSGYGAALDTWDMTTPRWGITKYIANSPTVMIEGVFNSNDVYFNAGGNIGIGTTAPRSKVEVRSGANAEILLNREGSWAFAASGLKLTTDDAATDFWTFGMRPDSTNHMRLRYNANEFMTFMTSGRVGVNAPNPRAGLEVKSTASVLVAGDSNDAGSLKLARDLPSAVTGGSVIGYIQAQSAFDATGALATGGELRFRADGNWASSSYPTRFTISTGTAGSAALVERMRVDSSGNVGIGVQAPEARLHVQGNARFTGAVRIEPQGDLPMGSFTQEP